MVIRALLSLVLLASFAFAPLSYAKPVTYRLHTPGVV